jgi:type 1 fimbria pilin
MKKLVVGLSGSLLLAAVLFAAPKDSAYTGEIMDGACAKNASHGPMLKKEGMGDKDPNDPMAKKMCTQGCVKMGGKYVLFNAKNKTVYQLDDQTKPADFAGGNVKVTGTLDKATQTIHVTNIEAAS